jgi:hypothetical protein
MTPPWQRRAVEPFSQVNFPLVEHVAPGRGLQAPEPTRTISANIDMSAGDMQRRTLAMFPPAGETRVIGLTIRPDLARPVNAPL